ncbi:MAG TPA: pyridoxal 5'-phosphate synthase glutaminase subunit PdxT [Longimicrobiales bacterium]|nr:pyridoxal 5'-phosphate synthase glutaminase subunit PdxT [Longimicrobiales bacterium]
MPSALRIGVLALQGDVVEHERALRRLGVEPVRVKRPDDLEQVDALVLPGGESPAMIRLLRSSGLDRPLRDRLSAGMPVFGTCAGLILLARDSGDPEVTGFGALDLAVERNAYGRQLDSFECALPDHTLGGAPLEAVFIRAPAIRDLGAGVEVLARHEGRPVAVRQGNAIGTAFHPELTDDPRLYQALIERVQAAVDPARDDAA